MKCLKLEKAKQLYEIHQAFNKHTEPACKCGFISSPFEDISNKFIINFLEYNKDKIYEAIDYLYQINTSITFFGSIIKHFKDTIDWGKVNSQIINQLSETLIEHIPVHKFRFSPAGNNKSYIEKFIIKRNDKEEILFYINKFKPSINGLYLYADNPEKYFKEVPLSVNITYAIINDDERLEKLDKLLQKKIGMINVLDECKRDVITLLWKKGKYGLIYLTDINLANYIVMRDFKIENIDDFLSIVNNIIKPYRYKMDLKLHKPGCYFDLYLNKNYYRIFMMQMI